MLQERALVRSGWSLPRWVGMVVLGAGSGYPKLYPYASQYPRGSHASLATIITERDCCQSGIGSLDI